VLVGQVSSAAVTRELANGEIVSSFDIVTHTENGRVSVPVSMQGEQEVPECDTQVCVIGFVRRRFFRSGSRVESRTEVVTSEVIPMRRKAQVRRAISRVVENFSTLI